MLIIFFELRSGTREDLEAAVRGCKHVCDGRITSLHGSSFWSILTHVAWMLSTSAGFFRHDFSGLPSTTFTDTFALSMCGDALCGDTLCGDTLRNRGVIIGTQ